MQSVFIIITWSDLRMNFNMAYMCWRKWHIWNWLANRYTVTDASILFYLQKMSQKTRGQKWDYMTMLLDLVLLMEIAQTAHFLSRTTKKWWDYEWIYKRFTIFMASPFSQKVLVNTCTCVYDNFDTCILLLI